MILFIVELFANVNRFSFYIEPLSEQYQYVMSHLNYIQF